MFKDFGRRLGRDLKRTVEARLQMSFELSGGKLKVRPERLGVILFSPLSRQFGLVPVGNPTIYDSLLHHFKQESLNWRVMYVCTRRVFHASVSNSIFLSNRWKGEEQFWV